MAICDANLVDNMPRSLTAFGGLDALVHALESYVSVCATDYTKGLSLQAIKMCFEFLPRSYKNGAADPVAREKMHNAATIAGMAFANGARRGAARRRPLAACVLGLRMRARPTPCSRSASWR